MALRTVAPSRFNALWREPATATAIANFAILLGNAVAGIVSARALGPEGKGQLAVAMLWSALIGMVGSFGLSSSCSYYVALWPNRRLALAVWLRRMAAKQTIFMTLVSIPVMSWLHIRLHLMPALAVEYTTWAGAAALTLYGTCFVQGTRSFMRFNVIRIISGTGPAALICAISIPVHLTAAEAGAAYLVPVLCSALLAWLWLHPTTLETSVLPLSKAERRSLWSYGLRNLGSFSGLSLNSNGDQLALGILVPAGFIGVYSVAASACGPLSTVVTALGMAGLPTVASLVGRRKARAARRIQWRAVLLLAAALPAAALTLPFVIPFLYGEQYRAAVVPSEILLLGTTFSALSSVTDDMLRAYGRPGFVFISQGIGGFITIAGTVLLGGRPLTAVALASSLGFLATLVLASVRLRRVIRQAQTDAGQIFRRRTPSKWCSRGRSIACADGTPSPSAVQDIDPMGTNAAKHSDPPLLPFPGLLYGKHRRNLRSASLGTGRHRRRPSRHPSSPLAEPK
jgi:O-antigen/teichoic acid export membrane protein